MRVLVLCGGRSRGAVEVGFAQALWEAGVRFDGIVGSSVGALNGAFLAAGGHPDALADWLRVAFQPSVLGRGLLYAVVVGCLLVGINHGDAILRGDVDSRRLLRIALTILVPYLVSTFSSVGAIRELRGSKDVGAER